MSKPIIARTTRFHRFSTVPNLTQKTQFLVHLNLLNQTSKSQDFFIFFLIQSFGWDRQKFRNSLLFIKKLGIPRVSKLASIPDPPRFM